MEQLTRKGDGKFLWLVIDFASKRAQKLANILPFDLLLYDEVVEQQIRDLLGQLTSREIPKSFCIAEIVNESYVLVALNPERTMVTGIGILTPCGPSFLGHKGIIEEIIVHRAHRRNGIGRRILTLLVGRAWNMHLTELQLTSNPKNPDRREAILLYLSEGFSQPDTQFLTREF
ncbi:hypothetical protein A2239_01310 [Candidatus Uhrbacteria bacterium RIFOXYA2_FULL_40_9]|nr:MAG: hypothetical protein UT94_C0050G0002 [Candidatus Uhrbacteria bacterium GW2011_GWF2_40_263]OGL93592.1 MAG: hypothetical protein A2239_01310 [Candidatus Uhrbacteria bacterium RIFOXYA2_FULL_40_9]OGL97152.1 MAG: hypothetical protein A2332_03600 [Candidatus Uhrbacteria bacterium RIFOXYB2_FULL_41_18]HBK35071.1 hypothetical protein [Candidatus Uhrbacteria bacterium]HCB56224.1 hypothetical protein [Candidatus Uhrbacteria bacterium]